MPEIAVGRQEIMEALRVQDWGTVRNWKRNYALPIRYMPNKKPMLILSEVQSWMIKYSELKNAQKK